MIAKPDTIIEGTWEEVSRRSKELEGKRVRVVVLEQQPESTLESKLQWLREAEKLVPDPPMRPPTEFEQILIEKFRKQGIEVD